MGGGPGHPHLKCPLLALEVQGAVPVVAVPDRFFTVFLAVPGGLVARVDTFDGGVVTDLDLDLLWAVLHHVGAIQSQGGASAGEKDACHGEAGNT